MADNVPEAVAENAISVQEYLDQVKIDADEAVRRLETFVLANQPWVDFEAEEPFYPEQAIKVDPENSPNLDRAFMKLDMSLYDPDRFKAHTYVSDFFDFLEPKLTEFIETGGTGIDDAVQTAIFDNHRERKEQIRDDALLVATANVGKMGFPLPTDMVQAARLVVITKFSEEDFNTSREITVLIAELAQKNVQHAIDAGIRMEAIQSEFTRFFHQAYTEYARQILEKFRIEQETNVQEFRGEIELITTQLRADEINSSLDQKFRDQEMARWRVSGDHAIEKTRSLMNQSEEAYKLQLQASTALTEYYRTVMMGVAGQLNTITTASDSTTSSS